MWLKMPVFGVASLLATKSIVSDVGIFVGQLSKAAKRYSVIEFDCLSLKDVVK